MHKYDGIIAALVSASRFLRDYYISTYEFWRAFRASIKLLIKYTNANNEVKTMTPTRIVPVVSPSLIADINGFATSDPKTNSVSTTTTCAIALFSIFTPLLNDNNTTPKRTGIKAVFEEVAKYPHPPITIRATELIKCAVYAFMFSVFCKYNLKGNLQRKYVIFLDKFLVSKSFHFGGYYVLIF